MGLLDWLSPAVNATAQTVSAFGAADDARAKAKQNAVVQQIQMLRQQKEDALKQSLGESTISKNNAEIGNYQSEAQDRTWQQQHPKIDPNAPDVLTRKQQLGIEENTQKIKDENRFGYHAPVFGSYEQVQSVDSTGQPIVSVLDKHTGAIAPTTTKGKPLPGKAGGAAADRTTAQLETAAGQATLADKGMTAYEQRVLSKQASLNPLAMHLARSAIAGSTTAEATLNTLNPELASYVRFAKQVASAERMITPRGGSNALAQAEAMLSGAGASGTPDQIKNAREYRAALIHGLTSHTAPPATPAATPTQGSQAQQLWDQAVKLHGREKVEQEVGPRPTE